MSTLSYLYYKCSLQKSVNPDIFYKLLKIILNHLSYLKDNIFRHFFQEKITSFHFLEG